MELFVFAVAASVVVIGALGVVLNANPVHAALSLVGTLFGIAVLFVAQEAHFLAAVQVIVYAGAIVVLFLFVLMLLGVDNAEDLTIEPIAGHRIAALVVGLCVLAMPLLALASTSGEATGRPAEAGSPNHLGDDVDGLEALGTSLFTDYLFAFEVTSVLLVIAVVGAVVLSRKVKRDDLVADPLVIAAEAEAAAAADSAQEPAAVDEPAGDPA